MVVTAVVSSIYLTKSILTMSIYFVCIYQVINCFTERWEVIKNIFINTFRPNEYQLYLDSSPALGFNFVIRVLTPLITTELLSTAIMDCLDRATFYYLVKYFAIIILILNNLLYIFKFSFIISLAVVLFRRILAYKSIGDFAHAFENLLWFLLVSSIILMHLLDPFNDYIIGNWKMPKI